VKPKKPTRRDLLLVIGELQDIIGAIGGSAMNDRQRERAESISLLVSRGMTLCIQATRFDPPLTGKWPR
jgi:hypothetical protein